MRLTILLFLGAVLAGCASVPSTSAPQAIGTVERPVPSNLPKPSPGMDPDVLLREFLKATADLPTGTWRRVSSSPNRLPTPGTTPAARC